MVGADGVDVAALSLGERRVVSVPRQNVTSEGRCGVGACVGLEPMLKLGGQADT